MSSRTSLVTRAVGAAAAVVLLAGLVALSVHRSRNHVVTRPAATGETGGGGAVAGDEPAISVPKTLGSGVPSIVTTAPTAPATTIAAPITPAPGKASLPGPVKPTTAGT